MAIPSFESIGSSLKIIGLKKPQSWSQKSLSIGLNENFGLITQCLEASATHPNKVQVFDSVCFIVFFAVENLVSPSVFFDTVSQCQQPSSVTED